MRWKGEWTKVGGRGTEREREGNERWKKGANQGEGCEGKKEAGNKNGRDIKGSLERKFKEGVNERKGRKDNE